VVAPIKMEGYLNIDSGTLNPYRHGEVFVLDDGTECDMDLGTYERMLDQNLTRRNFVTSGQIYREILDRERHGGYLGRDVQMIPHVTGEVKRKLRELAVYGDGTGPRTSCSSRWAARSATTRTGSTSRPARAGVRGGPGVVLLRGADLRHRAADAGRAEEQGGAAGHQAADGGGDPAAAHRVPRGAPGQTRRCSRRSRCSATCRCGACSACTTARASTRSPTTCARRGSTARS
jgi:hypothetical protein